MTRPLRCHYCGTTDGVDVALVCHPCIARESARTRAEQTGSAVTLDPVRRREIVQVLRRGVLNQQRAARERSALEAETSTSAPSVPNAGVEISAARRTEERGTAASRAAENVFTNNGGDDARLAAESRRRAS